MMITILVEFFDKKTKFIANEKKIEVPYDLVLAAAAGDEYTGNELSEAMAEGKQIDYINCRPFGVTEEIKAYAIEHHPELKEKFEKYLYEFIGRHGLGPEYD
jgi:hypothetical protein